jgi:hypothetical protein
MSDTGLRENLMVEEIRPEDAIDPVRVSEALPEVGVREVCLSEDILLEDLCSSIPRPVGSPREDAFISDILDAAGSLILRSVDILRSDCLTTEDFLTISDSYILRSVEVLREDFLSVDILLERTDSDTLRSAESLWIGSLSNVDLLDPSV